MEYLTEIQLWLQVHLPVIISSALTIGTIIFNIINRFKTLKLGRTVDKTDKVAKDIKKDVDIFKTQLQAEFLNTTEKYKQELETNFKVKMEKLADLEAFMQFAKDRLDYKERLEFEKKKAVVLSEIEEGK